MGAQKDCHDFAKVQVAVQVLGLVPSMNAGDLRKAAEQVLLDYLSAKETTENA